MSFSWVLFSKIIRKMEACYAKITKKKRIYFIYERKMPRKIGRLFTRGPAYRIISGTYKHRPCNGEGLANRRHVLSGAGAFAAVGAGFFQLWHRMVLFPGDGACAFIGAVWMSGADYIDRLGMAGFSVAVAVYCSHPDGGRLRHRGAEKLASGDTGT